MILKRILLVPILTLSLSLAILLIGAPPANVKGDTSPLSPIVDNTQPAAPLALPLPTSQEPLLTRGPALAPIQTPPAPIAPAAPAPTKKVTVAATSIAPASLSQAKPATCTTGSYANQFLCLFNQYRVKNNLGKLSFDTTLSQVALKHSIWMASTGIFSHIGENGSKFYERCQAGNTTCLAENLAVAVGSPQHLLDMWIASPAHNRNLLGPYSIAGFGMSSQYITLDMR